MFDFIHNVFDLVVVQPIFNILMAIYSVIPGGDFGIAIVIFTIFIRLAIWPLIKKQMHQVKAMRKLQPELVKIKKKAKGNKQLEGMQMLELYKKHNINPFRSIGLLLIQLPIFISLFIVIKIFTDHHDQIQRFTYDFLEGLSPVAKLISDPASFNQNFLGFIDLTQHAIGQSGINIYLILFALIAGVLQYVSSKQTMPQQESKKGLRKILAEASEGKDPDQTEINAAVMGKMVKILPIMMVFIMLNLPGAITLYYVVQTIVAVMQQKSLLQQDEEEMEAIADEATKKQSKSKKPSAQKRAKTAKEATEVATVTRITAASSKSKKGKKGGKK